MNSKYLTFRELNQLLDRRGYGIKSENDFEFLCRQHWHPKIDELNFLFKMSHKNKKIKKMWMAKNVKNIYKYHRTFRAQHNV